MAQSSASDEMTYGDYREEIEFIADMIEERHSEDPVAFEESEAVHEEVDSHQWIIYTAYHLDILQHSDEEPQEWKHLVADGDSWRDVIQALAFDAMRNDVWEDLDDRRSVSSSETTSGTGRELHDRDTDF